MSLVFQCHAHRIWHEMPRGHREAFLLLHGFTYSWADKPWNYLPGPLQDAMRAQYPRADETT